MRILLVTQYFWPENFIVNDLVKCLILEGHDVVVFTGKPNYPDGKVFSGYEEKGSFSERYMQKVKVYRAPLRERGKGALGILRNYISFIINGLLYFPYFLKSENDKFDVVLVYAPSPITSVIPAIFLKWKLKSHLAVWVQDLWPESLSATGFVKSPLLLRVVGEGVRLIYYFTDTLLVQSRGFEKSVLKYTSIDKVVYYPNFYSKEIGTVSSATKIPNGILDVLDKNFCFLFAGNLGFAQSLETLLDAAVLVRELPCKIMIVGSGVRTEWLRNEVNKLGLTNVVLAGRYDPVEMPQFFVRAKGLIVTLKKSEVFSLTVPSKVQAYLAAGRPIVAAIDGEGARIISEAKAGLSCRAEDSVALASIIKEMLEFSENNREEMGRSGYRYFCKNFEAREQTQRLVEILAQRVKVNKGEAL